MAAEHGAHQNKPLRLEAKGEQKKFPITEDMGSALAALVKASDGFKSWAAAAAPEFKVLGEGWDICADVSTDVESMQAFAGRIIDAMTRSWTTQMQKTVGGIEDLCLPHALLHSSRMMLDKASQQLLADASKKLHESGLLHTASEQLAVLKHAETEAEVLSKLAGKSQLMRFRRLGRVTLAVNWAIDQVTGFVPQKTSRLRGSGGEGGEQAEAEGLQAEHWPAKRDTQLPLELPCKDASRGCQGLGRSQCQLGLAKAS